MSDSFATPWTVVCQAPLSMGFPGNTGTGCHFLLHGIFPIQGSNLHLLHWQADSLPLSLQGTPVTITKTNRKKNNLSFPGNNTVNDKSSPLPYKRILLSLHAVHHGCNTLNGNSLLIPNKFIFAGEISGHLFV